MNISVRAELEHRGFACFTSPASIPSCLELARLIGVIDKSAKFSEMQTLVPRKSSTAEVSSYSGNYGLGEFPFHTDMAHWWEPPRFLLLRCESPGQGVITSVIPSKTMFLGENPDELRRALFRPRRRLDGRFSVLRLKDGDISRWDPLFLTPLTKRSRELQNRVALRIASAQAIEARLDHVGACIILDNWRILHARSAVQEHAATRRIQRVFLSSITC